MEIASGDVVCAGPLGGGRGGGGADRLRVFVWPGGARAAVAGRRRRVVTTCTCAGPAAGVIAQVAARRSHNPNVVSSTLTHRSASVMGKAPWRSRRLNAAKSCGPRLGRRVSRAYMIVRRGGGVAIRDAVIAAVDHARARIPANVVTAARAKASARVRAR